MPVEIVLSPEEVKENLRKWVQALRSGEYQQGREFMRSSNTYCCLGVAMEVAYANGCPRDPNPNWGQTSLLPANVSAWYGSIPPEKTSDLANRNDAGVPFEVIANIISDCYQPDQED